MNIPCSKIFDICTINCMVTNSIQLGYVNNDDKNRYYNVLVVICLFLSMVASQFGLEDRSLDLIVYYFNGRF